MKGINNCVETFHLMMKKKGYGPFHLPVIRLICDPREIHKEKNIYILSTHYGRALRYCVIFKTQNFGHLWVSRVRYIQLTRPSNTCINSYINHFFIPLNSSPPSTKQGTTVPLYFIPIQLQYFCFILYCKTCFLKFFKYYIFIYLIFAYSHLTEVSNYI